MRLINVKTMQLEEFASHRLQTYAILSHRWEEDEVAFEEWNDPKIKLKQGYQKIKDFCRLVLERHEEGGFSKYAWVDTCCIDKRSSAELSEAINSMYEWYRDAECCCVFLSDIVTADTISESVWFTRCWTLQELIAPELVLFHNQNWQPLGSKSNLQDVIVQATGIEKDVLRGKSVFEYSIAQRMSWAAKRCATRVEDKAYSLMGMFEVNMPMLYGEGDRAFIRLQEEIIRRSDDHSIFAWELGDQDTNSSMVESACSGLLSKDPSSYRRCSKIIRSTSTRVSEGYSMTNVGLAITLPAIPWDMDTYCAVLSCTDAKRPGKHVAIFLRQQTQSDQYVRVRYKDSGIKYVLSNDWRWDWLKSGGEFRSRQFLVRQNAMPDLPFTHYGFRYCLENLSRSHQLHLDMSLAAYSKHFQTVFLFPGASGAVCELSFKSQRSFHIQVALGFDIDFNPVVCIQADPENRRKAKSIDIWDNEWISSADTQIDPAFVGLLPPGSVPHGRSGVILNPQNQSLYLDLPWAGMKASLIREVSRPGAVGIWTLRIVSYDIDGLYELEDTSIHLERPS